MAKKHIRKDEERLTEYGISRYFLIACIFSGIHVVFLNPHAALL
jgi:hypothetical protein